MDETKVIYYVDDEETPYLMKIQIPPDKITLGHFKNALNKPNCKYFFKSMDDDFGVVKEEIADDDVVIPCLGGRVVSWLISKEVSEKSDNETVAHGSHIFQHRNGSTEDIIPSSGYQTASSQHQSTSNVPIASRPSPKCHRSNNSDSERQGSDVGGPVTDLNQRHKLSGSESGLPLEDGDAEDGLVSADRVPPLRNFQDYRHAGGRGGSKSHHHHNQPGLPSTAGLLETASVQSSDIESTSFFDSEEESSRFSTATGTTMSSIRYNRHRRQKRRHRMPAAISRASSFSSMTDSTMSLNIVTVTLNLETVNFLGISIVGQSNKVGDGGIYVGSIMKGGAVAQDGRIEPGDMILEVNNISFESMSNDEAVRTLREQVQKPGPITLVVAKCWQSGKAAAGYNTNNDTTPMSKQPNNFPNSNVTGGGAISGLNMHNPHHRPMPESIGPSTISSQSAEPVRPIDPRAWVLHTNAALNQLNPMSAFPRPGGASNLIQQALPQGPPLSAVNSQGGATTSSSSLPDCERGHGGPLMSVLNASVPPSCALTKFSNGGQTGASTALSLSSMDMISIVAALIQPDSGLPIRDRTWLKISIPNAFIGSDLVDWLYNHVEGFADRKDAKKYASNLLKFGYIRHTVNKSTFSEQCYYVFGDVLPLLSNLNLENLESVSQVGRNPTNLHSVQAYLRQQQSQPPLAHHIQQSGKDFPHSPASGLSASGGSGASSSLVSPSQIQPNPTPQPQNQQTQQSTHIGQPPPPYPSALWSTPAPMLYPNNPGNDSVLPPPYHSYFLASVPQSGGGMGNASLLPGSVPPNTSLMLGGGSSGYENLDQQQQQQHMGLQTTVAGTRGGPETSRRPNEASTSGSSRSGSDLE